MREFGAQRSQKRAKFPQILRKNDFSYRPGSVIVSGVIEDHGFGAGAF
ncbi:hypothetical protein SMB34_14285 [Thalassospira permensis NBRC 106175]|uniref:Uncharacterized protein n=1 Tax=Thalassospira permensis NBRC 106175 TaxID=1353532 RepID=A0ABR4TTA6_9PROT|nr:hypothetical protein SMB34_14285 [Thalassospira permensis NBRC 106175]